MKIVERRFIGVNTIGVNTTEEQSPTTKKSFSYDEAHILKTDLKEYNVWIILTPKFKKPPSQSSKLDSLEQTNTNALFIIINEHLSHVKCVEKILFLKKEDTIHIWTAISEYASEENRRLIYNQEKKLTGLFSKVGFHFDFFIVEPEDVTEIESLGASVIWEKK